MTRILHWEQPAIVTDETLTGDGTPLSPLSAGGGSAVSRSAIRQLSEPTPFTAGVPFIAVQMQIAADQFAAGEALLVRAVTTIGGAFTTGGDGTIALQVSWTDGSGTEIYGNNEVQYTNFEVGAAFEVTLACQCTIPTGVLVAGGYLTLVVDGNNGNYDSLYVMSFTEGQGVGTSLAYEVIQASNVSTAPAPAQ